MCGKIVRQDEMKGYGNMSTEKNTIVEDKKRNRTLFIRQTVLPLIIIIVNFSIAMAVLWWSGDWGKRFYADNYLFRDGRMPIKQEDGKWQVIDDNGSARGEQYADIRPFANRMAAVENDEGKWGYIDTDSTLVIECVYDSAGDFSQSGLAAVKDGENYFYINKKGEKQFDKTFINAENFDTNSIAKVTTEEGVGLLNIHGEYILIPGAYAELGEIAMENGYVAVRNNEGKWGYIDSLGNVIAECKYAAARTFLRERAVVVNDEGLYGFINETGDEIVPCIYTAARNYSIALYAAVRDENGKWGYVNKSGAVTVECAFADCFDFSNDESAAVQNDEGKWGYIKNNGKFIIECQYAKATKFSGNDTAAVQKENGKWIYINRNGDTVIDDEYDYADGFTEVEIAIVGKYMDGKLSYALIDEKGKCLVDYGAYDMLVAYDSGEIYGYSQNGKYTLLGTDGSVIAEDIIGFKPAGDVVVRR